MNGFLDMPIKRDDFCFWKKIGSRAYRRRLLRMTPRCKKFWSSWHSAVLHQCIWSLVGAGLLRNIMDIGARAFSLADRPQRAIWVASFRMRPGDRFSTASHLLADLCR